MTERMERLLACMEEHKTDGVLVADGCNMRYLSGFSGATGYLCISEKHRLILTDSRYTTQAKEESTDFDVVEVSGVSGYEEQIGKWMREDGIRHLGFEDQVMIYADVARLQCALPPTEWKGLAGALNELRIIKSEEELACIAQAEHIGDEAFTHILEVLHPGMTELEVAIELESHMKRCGAENLSFETIAASGLHSAMPHAAPSAKKLKNGDFLTMDYGCKYKGYCSDMTRTVVIGKANDRQKEIYGVVLAAQEAALAVIREGLTGDEVDRVAREIIREAGYGDYFGHGLGHGVGLFIHEEPRLSPTGHRVLKRRMTQTVEPGIYVPGFGGVRIEDLVEITADGCRNLTGSPKQLIEIC